MCRECGLYISAVVDVQPVWSVDLGDESMTPVAFHGNCWPRVRRMWAKRYNKNVNRVIYRVHPKIWGETVQTCTNEDESSSDVYVSGDDNGDADAVAGSVSSAPAE